MSRFVSETTYYPSVEELWDITRGQGHECRKLTIIILNCPISLSVISYSCYRVFSEYFAHRSHLDHTQCSIARLLQCYHISIRPIRSFCRSSRCTVLLVR